MNKLSTIFEEFKKDRFESYRQAIKKKYNFDISKYKDKIKGGKADGKKITAFKLDQIIMGIEAELEHTDSTMASLEIVLDHLVEIDTYYTHLKKMEKDAKGD